MTPDTDTRRVTLRELDALVAEHVMGWRHIEQLKDEGADDDESHVSSIEAGGTTPWKAAGDGNWIRWQPSTDWRHTGELWEKLVAEDWYVGVEDWIGAVAHVLENRDPSMRHGDAGDEERDGHLDPRVALCLAALRAYGVEVELETEEAC